MFYLSFIDLFLAPFALFLIFYLANLKKNNSIDAHPEYKYYIPGLIAKVFGGICVCLIYTFYYRGGDTVNYFHDGLVMKNLLFKRTNAFFDVLINGLNYQNLFYFTRDIGWPIYYNDHTTFIVVRLTCFLVVFSFGSFIVTTILIAWISYAGVWKLYQVFVSEFPEIKKELAIAVLFIPSVVFWGSGLLKDTITFSAVGFLVHAFYKAFIKRENMFFNTITILISSSLIISIKPYIFFALLPGTLLWFVGSIIEKFRGNIIKFFVTPVLLLSAFMMAYFTLEALGDKLDHYSLDNVMDRAVIVQRDLKQDYYYGSSFDIGNFEATVPSMLSKAPAAIVAAIFRPYIWESNNPVMALSGIENFLMLSLTVYLIFKVRLIKFIKLMFTHNLLVFSLIFSLFFAFAVGLTTSNFGSLVRYKIPLLPFYVASLFIIRHFDIKLTHKMETENEERKKKLGERVPFIGQIKR